MKTGSSPLAALLLLVAGCGGPGEVRPPANAVGMEAPSDTSSRNARIAGRWLSDQASLPKGVVRLEIAADGTYGMKMLQSRDELVDTIVSASAGDLTWDRPGFVHGRDEHPAPDMKRFGRWTAGFEGDGERMVMATETGTPVTFVREPQS